MDAAGSIVGILSLGISCCHGLINYYNAWKDRDETIRTTLSSIKSLVDSLNLLKRSLVGRQTSPDVQRHLEKSIMACEESIGRLQKKLVKVQKDSNSKNISSRISFEIQKALYPFKESTLAKLREIVQDIRDNLNVPLAIVQIQSSNKLHEAIEDLKIDAQSTATNLASVSHGVAQIEQTFDVFRNDATRDKILQWLFQADATPAHLAAQKRHESGTGNWIFETDNFKSWLANPSFLWIYGMPGCGKTVLSSVIIQDLKQSADHEVAYFYFSFSDPEKQSLDKCLSSIILQLLQQRPIPAKVQELYNQQYPASPSGLAQVFEAVVDSIPEDVFVVIDAIDECMDQELQNVLQWLEETVHSQIPSLHILATSRPNPEIEDVLLGAKAASSVTAIALDSGPLEHDIDLYITRELERDRKLKMLDAAVKADIKKVLGSGAGGMFRWVYCQMEELKSLRPMRARAVEAVLKSLPSSLDETYERILLRLESCYKEALAALQWLAFSSRPLQLQELAEACIIEPTAKPPVDQRDRFPPQEISEILSSLATTSTRPEGLHGRIITEIRLTHFSVKEYLVSDRIRKSKAAMYAVNADLAHSFIFTSCIAYLTMYSEEQRSKTAADLDCFPLLTYAATRWYVHARDNNQPVYDFLTSNSLSDWLQVHVPDQPWIGGFQGKFDPPAPIYYASFLGFEDVVQQLLDLGQVGDTLGGYYGTALQAACAKGFEGIAVKLLTKVDVNASGGRYGNALQAAASQGHTNLVSILLQHGAEINAAGGEFGSALQSAIYCNQPEVFRLLLDNGADPKAQGVEYGDALQTASWWGRSDMVLALLERKFDVNTVGGEYATALQAASYRGYGDIVRMLLDKGADCNAAGGYYGGALQAAASQGYDNIVLMLLDAGADINATGGRYGSALNAAHYWCHAETVKLLLARGIATRSAMLVQGPAYQATFYIGSDLAIKAFLARGRDLNAKDPFGRTLLIVTTRLGFESHVERLLRFGARTEEKDTDHGKTALHWAAELGLLCIVNCLLDYHADVLARDNYGETPLHYAAENGHLRVVETLCQADSSVNALDKRSRTPLTCAKDRRHTEVVQLLAAFSDDERGTLFRSA